LGVWGNKLQPPKTKAEPIITAVESANERCISRHLSINGQQKIYYRIL
jgi:hypothetical protein